MYCAWGSILRKTIFIYNLKSENMDSNAINGTLESNRITEYLRNGVFEQPLDIEGFPLTYVFWYLLSIGGYIILAILYYRFFRPWTVLIDHGQIEPKVYVEEVIRTADTAASSVTMDEDEEDTAVTVTDSESMDEDEEEEEDTAF